MKYLLWAALPVAALAGVLCWVVFFKVTDAKTPTTQLECSLDYVNKLGPRGIDRITIAQWGFDYEILSPVAFQQKHGHDTYSWMVAANVACRDGWDKDEAGNAEAAAGEAISHWLRNGGQ